MRKRSVCPLVFQTAPLERIAMGSIAFSTKPEESWAAAGWVLRQVLDDTASQHPQDSEMASEFEAAKTVDGLMVYLLQPDLAVRVTTRMRAAVEGVLSGTLRSGILNQPYGDERTVAQYSQALERLLDAFPLAGTSEGQPQD
jgi:hypothetical protein